MNLRDIIKVPDIEYTPDIIRTTAAERQIEVLTQEFKEQNSVSAAGEEIVNLSNDISRLIEGIDSRVIIDGNEYDAEWYLTYSGPADLRTEYEEQISYVEPSILTARVLSNVRDGLINDLYMLSDNIYSVNPNSKLYEVLSNDIDDAREIRESVYRTATAVNSYIDKAVWLGLIDRDALTKFNNSIQDIIDRLEKIRKTLKLAVSIYSVDFSSLLSDIESRLMGKAMEYAIKEAAAVYEHAYDSLIAPVREITDFLSDPAGSDIEAVQAIRTAIEKPLQEIENRYDRTMTDMYIMSAKRKNLRYDMVKRTGAMSFIWRIDAAIETIINSLYNIKGDTVYIPDDFPTPRLADLGGDYVGYTLGEILE